MQESQTVQEFVTPPRPVFDGDWSKASGKQRQEHMTKVAAWKRDHGGQGSDEEAGSPQTRSAPQVEEHAADLQALQHLIDGPKTLGSDRIRAIEAKQRILQRVQEEEQEERYGALVALRQALDLLPPEDRGHALSTLLGVQGVQTLQVDTPHGVHLDESVSDEGAGSADHAG